MSAVAEKNQAILLRPGTNSNLRKQLDKEAKERNLRSGNQAAVVLLEEYFSKKKKKG